MAKTKKPKTVETTHYQHDDATRKNIPSAAMEAEGAVPKAKRVKYAYSPHLDPVLRFDPAGRADKVAEIVEKSCRGDKLTPAEQEILRAVGKNWEQPWLEWAGKQEEHARGHFSVDPVALHIHERLSAQAIIRNAMREDAQRSLFGGSEQAYAEAVQFYKHDIDWANRLILGDSLQVMSSLAQRENLTGKVQMIYMDPPYGIGFASNFQPQVGSRDVKDGRDSDLTREPEMVRAFRDTWHLGTSSYLTYLRERLIGAKSLLTNTGSLFVQINAENLDIVRRVVAEVFGQKNIVSTISFRKTSPLGSSGLATVHDYIVWAALDIKHLKYHQLYEQKPVGEDTTYTVVELPTGERRRMTAEERGNLSLIPKGAKIACFDNPRSSGYTASCFFEVNVAGRCYPPQKYSWKTNAAGMTRLSRAGRLHAAATLPYYVRFFDDFAVRELTSSWDDTRGEMEMEYVVQTSETVVQRCLLMSTDPGDLVLDPTCGSGTTACVAERWGRRWIAIDTSRVAIAIARQRLLTAQFDHYATNGGPDALGGIENPSSGFRYKRAAHITLGAIAQNNHLDSILEEYEPQLNHLLEVANRELSEVSPSLRKQLADKFASNYGKASRRSALESDRRRWLLPPSHRDPQAPSNVPKDFSGWYEWEFPFDTDPDWPEGLRDAVTKYRSTWQAKMQAVNRCIADNAVQEDLVDQPELVRGVVRVSGPFSVEGVIPEELSVGEDGEAFDPTPNDGDEDVRTEAQNLSAYLARMVSHLRTDGLTFLNNQKKTFGRLDAIFEEGSGSFLHAEGTWDGDEESSVAITFGPQYGPVTVLQVEETIRASKRYTDLVIAGFSFDAETYAVVEAQPHPKLKIHIAQIRPDLNESMDGLLKTTPNSQLFTVFGQPDIKVKHTKDGWVCELEGVVIYNPTDNTIRSANADKVAAWFLDSDYDGRCFCATQAFFPNRDAWEKIAKALGSQADEEAFEAFNGTKSLPFQEGKYKRIAVKVIDPRGNEVMAIRRLQ